MSEKIITSIRHATVADAALLAELGARTFSETFAADNSEENMAEYLATSFNPERQRSELADPLATFLLAEIEGVAAGYAMLRAGPPPHQADAEKPIELVRLYISREWHGRGVGETLMQACLAKIREQGYRTLWLGVWEHNARARAFYRKLQFEECGEHIFQLGGDPQNDILMRRGISNEF